MKISLPTLLIVSLLSQATIASGDDAPLLSLPKCQLSKTQKNAIIGTTLLVGGISTIVGLYFGTLQYRCPRHASCNPAIPYDAPLQCCKANETTIYDCTNTISYSCPQDKIPSCLINQPGSDIPPFYKAAEKHPSSDGGVTAGFVVSGISLTLGAVWLTLTYLCC